MVEGRQRDSRSDEPYSGNFRYVLVIGAGKNGVLTVTQKEKFDTSAIYVFLEVEGTVQCLSSHRHSCVSRILMYLHTYACLYTAAALTGSISRG